MQKIVYRDRLVLLVNEITRAKALQVVQIVNTLVDMEIDNAGYISNEFHFAYVSNAPVKVLFDGKLLDNGSHVLNFGEYNEINLTLPLTRECFEELPISLTAQWIEAAESENGWLSDHFLRAMRLIVPSLFEPVSDKAQS